MDWSPRSSKLWHFLLKFRFQSAIDQVWNQTCQPHFEPLLHKVACGFRGSTLTNGSPTVTLQVCYNTFLPKVYRSKDTAGPKTAKWNCLAKSKLKPIWTFTNYSKFLYTTWKYLNMKVVLLSKIYNFDIWTSSKLSLDSKLHIWASLRFQLRLLFSNNLTTLGPSLKAIVTP